MLVVFEPVRVSAPLLPAWRMSRLSNISPLIVPVNPSVLPSPVRMVFRDME